MRAWSERWMKVVALTLAALVFAGVHREQFMFNDQPVAVTEQVI